MLVAVNSLITHLLGPSCLLNLLMSGKNNFTPEPELDYSHYVVGLLLVRLTYRFFFLTRVLALITPLGNSMGPDNDRGTINLLLKKNYMGHPLV